MLFTKYFRKLGYCRELKVNFFCQNWAGSITYLWRPLWERETGLQFSNCSNLYHRSHIGQSHRISASQWITLCIHSHGIQYCWNSWSQFAEMRQTIDTIHINVPCRYPTVVWLEFVCIICQFNHTSILPHVWKAVNMNINPKPRIMMFKSVFPSGPMLAAGCHCNITWRNGLVKKTSEGVHSSSEKEQNQNNPWWHICRERMICYEY